MILYYNILSLEFPRNVQNEADTYNHSMHVCGAMEPVFDPPTPDYPYKYDLPRMTCYKRDLGEEYWKLWDVNRYSEKINNWISWTKVEEEAKACGYFNRAKLLKTKSILLNGATLGCEGTGRLPTRVENSPTVAAQGSKVADQLMDWTKSGIVVGPLKAEEMPFKTFKVSPMAVAPKPGGKIRIIVDMSAPHGIPADSPEANSVNMGIDGSKLVTNMSSLTQVCERIFYFGCPGEFCKADW